MSVQDGIQISQPHLLYFTLNFTFMSYTALLLIKLWQQIYGSVIILPAVRKMSLLNQLIHGSSYSWETHSCSSSQRIPHLTQNLKICYNVYNSPTMVPTSSPLNPSNTATSYFCKVNSNITIPFTPRSPKWYISIQ